MTPSQLQKLLAGGEGLHCEFKKAYDTLPANLFETVCAFLNTDGGDILLGVADDGRIVGVAPEKITRFKADIANLSNNAQKIEPTYLLFPEALAIDGKTVIVVHVPVSSQLHRVSGVIYMRSEDGDYRVHGTHQLAGIINRKLGLFSEQRAMPHFSMDDLRVDLFERARRLITAHHSQHPWTELSPEQLL
ncbi:AAA family ATPase, partial [candidate division KSB3 bacterium]